MKIARQQILELISMKPLSFEQIASELGLNERERVDLCQLLDNMRFSHRHPENRVIGLRINSQAPVLHERACVGSDTYLYYRLDQASVLEQQG